MNQVEQNNDTNFDPIDEHGLDINEYIALVVENRWLILGVGLLFFLGAIIYALAAKPIYRADALVQIETGKSRYVGRDELAAMMGGNETSTSATEMEILKSRTVLGNVVEKNNLAIWSKARYFPIFGEFLARRYRGNSPAEPWFGLATYAWGGERLTVSRLDITGGNSGSYRLVAGDNGQYTVTSQAGEKLFDGRVGEAALSADGRVRIFVSELRARPGTRFSIGRRDQLAMVRALQGRIRISEQGPRTGLLSIRLEGFDRENIRSIVQALMESYLRQSVEKRSEESEKMLAFIQKQLPAMRSDLDTAEQALNLYREKAGTIDLTMESQNLIERVTRLESDISKLGIERTELKQKLTDNHPVIRGIDEKLLRLEGQADELERQLKTVPEKELESVKLSRNVKVASQLYMLLLNKSQELKVSKAGTLGNVRIVDDAVVSAGPVKPNKRRIVLLSLLLGLAVGVVIAVIRKAMNKMVQDPAVIEKQLGYAVYAEVPFSDYQEEMVKSSKKRLHDNHMELLAHACADDQVIESLRSLRTSIQFALMEAENNIVSISGPSPGIGKSFISANFAYLMAESGKKILLVDADMRKGHLARYFKVDKKPGLSESLSGEHDFANTVHQGVLHENLDFLATGVYPPNPSEMLMSDAFKNLLSAASEQYDLVIIDTPPILAVTDAAIVAQYASTNFAVLRAGQHHLREIQTTFRRFEQNGVTIKGAIFNGVELRKGRYGYGGGKYGYKYYGYQYDYK